MKIDGMTLENFRLFRYVQEIEFLSTSKKPLTIIRAENRTGKTTVLTALQWCFYGDTVFTNVKQALSDGNMLASEDALAEAQVGDSVKTQVVVRFEHDGKDYVARRVQETQRGDSVAESRPASPASFTILELAPSGTKEVPNPSVFMGQILPKELRELFLFDGDRINAFMEPNHEEAVQKAVSDMLEFVLFDEAQSDLKAILAEYRSNLRGAASGESKALRDDLARLETQLDIASKDLEHQDSELRAENLLEEQLTSELAGTPGDAGLIQEKNNSNKTQIKSLETARRNLSDEMGRQLTQGRYYTSSPLLQQARDILRAKKDAGEIPRRIGEDLIKERLELKECICGRSLNPGEPACEHLIGQLATQKDRAVFDEVATETLYYLNAFSRKSREDLSTSLNDYLSQRVNIEQSIVVVGKQISELENEFDEIDIDAVAKKREAITQTRRRIQAIILAKAELTQTIRSVTHSVDEISKRLRQAERRDERNKALRHREQLAEQCLKALTLTHQSVREIERELISARTQENFFKMNIREDEFSKVEVTPSFRLQVINPQGQISNQVLSGAQRRALSLAFLFALIQVSERDAPVIVDTPLGMTSGPMRRSIAESMIRLTQQLVLLLTRSEIEDVEDILESGASAQLTLTCSRDYPREILNQPRLPGAYTEVCDCSINEHCTVCERIPSHQVS